MIRIIILLFIFYIFLIVHGHHQVLRGQGHDVSVKSSIIGVLDGLKERLR